MRYPTGQLINHPPLRNPVRAFNDNHAKGQPEIARDVLRILGDAGIVAMPMDELLRRVEAARSST